MILVHGSSGDGCGYLKMGYPHTLSRFQRLDDDLKPDSRGHNYTKTLKAIILGTTAGGEGLQEWHPAGNLI